MAQQDSLLVLQSNVVSLEQKAMLIEQFMAHLEVGPNIVTYLSQLMQKQNTA